MKILVCITIVLTVVIFNCAKSKEEIDSQKEIAVKQTDREELLDILNSRENWDPVPMEFKKFICDLLNKKDELKEFADLIEKYEITENNLVQYDTANQDQEWFFFQLSSTLTSAANYFGSKEEFGLTRKFAEFAIRFNSDHLPAYSSLALAYCFSGQDDLALSTCKKAETLFKEKAVFDKENHIYKITPGYVTLTPEMWKEMEQMFNYIEHECRKR